MLSHADTPSKAVEERTASLTMQDELAVWPGMRARLEFDFRFFSSPEIEVLARERMPPVLAASGVTIDPAAPHTLWVAAQDFPGTKAYVRLSAENQLRMSLFAPSTVPGQLPAAQFEIIRPMLEVQIRTPEKRSMMLWGTSANLPEGMVVGSDPVGEARVAAMKSLREKLVELKTLPVFGRYKFKSSNISVVGSSGLSAEEVQQRWSPSRLAPRPAFPAPPRVRLELREAAKRSLTAPPRPRICRCPLRLPALRARTRCRPKTNMPASAGNARSARACSRFRLPRSRPPPHARQARPRASHRQPPQKRPPARRQHPQRPPPTPPVVNTRERVLAGFVGQVPPVPTSAAYQLGILLTAIFMVLLPLLYIAIIGLACLAVYWHLTNNYTIMGAVRGRGAILALLVYLAADRRGGVMILFMIKPLFAGRLRRPTPQPHSPSEPLLFEFVDASATPSAPRCPPGSTSIARSTLRPAFAAAGSACVEATWC